MRFNSLDDYESGLLEHATKDEQGKFSQYIKRLNERDREGMKSVHNSVPSSSQIDDSEENERAVTSFLLKRIVKPPTDSEWFSSFFLLNKTIDLLILLSAL